MTQCWHSCLSSSFPAISFCDCLSGVFGRVTCGTLGAQLLCVTDADTQRAKVSLSQAPSEQSSHALHPIEKRLLLKFVLEFVYVDVDTLKKYKCVM